MKSFSNVSQNKLGTSFAIINKPARASLFLTLTNIFSKGCALLFTPIFTRILSPEDYGVYSLFSSYLSVLLVIGTLEISQGAMMRAMQKRKDILHLSMLIAAAITVLASLFASLAFTIIRKVTGGGELFRADSVYITVLCVSNGIINIYLAKSRFLYRWQPALITALVQSLLIPLLGIAALNLASDGVNRVGIKLAVASILSLALAIFFLALTAVLAAREIMSHLMGAREVYATVKDSLATLLKLSLPLLPYYLSIMLISQLNRHFILRSFGREAVAVFSVAYSLGIAASSVLSGIVGSLCAWIMRKIRAKDFEKIEKITAALIRISALGIVAVSSFFKEILSLIAPSQYSEGLPISLVTALSPLLLSLISLTSAALVAREKTLPVLISGIASASLSIALSLTLLPRLGAVFCAAVSLISYILVFAIQSAGIKRALGCNIVSPAVFISAIFLTTAALGAIYLFDDFIWIRALICALTLAALIKSLGSSRWILEERKREDSKSPFCESSPDK